MPQDTHTTADPDNQPLSTTRRDVLAATALTAVTAGCNRPRGFEPDPVGVDLYNPTAEPRTVQVMLVDTDERQRETRATVPPRASVGTGFSVEPNQTVTVRVTHDESTTVYEWAGEETLSVTLGVEPQFHSAAAVEAPRELVGGGRVDVRLVGRHDTTGGVRFTRDGEVVFETQRTFTTGSDATYHNRLRATGTVSATARNDDGELTEQLSLADATAVVVGVGEQLSFELSEPSGE
jgi:hypothetical protein